MSYTIHQAHTKTEFDEITDVMWRTMDGADPSHGIFFPTFGDGPDAKAAAIAESKERIWNQYKYNPASHWIYVREQSTGKVVASCQWRVYDENLFQKGPPTIVAVWWPEGSVGRKFASEVVNQCYTPRTRWMARPHLGLSQMCVLPSHQRRGIGSMLMHWGLEHTDQQGIESFIEATEAGRYLYEKFGYRAVKSVHVDMSRVNVEDEELEEWKELERKFLPLGYTALWRPIRGVQDEDEFKRTWSKRMSL
ncbi:hypothetical protein K505DRAFT_291735 [Melanomma pulvis-pyrius CBS 109.77]|uniref:N-acetyltransferase domain-containing protein n=1 Tax=Melanomma pulvis-pyrius CBS 109.77 TaxID=1314802 RepID=A0A6A6XWR6_9PLEO|nr:hypothetical protein K505DRAFT_291735 [Melanomma pulvis-pyrius CBS 109.77]